MKTQSREVLLKEAFDEVRIIVSADCRHSAMKDNNGNYVQLSNGTVQFPAVLHTEDDHDLPKEGVIGSDMQAKVAQNFARFVSQQTAMYIFDGAAEEFRKVDLRRVSISEPSYVGKEGSASVYTVKPGLF